MHTDEVAGAGEGVRPWFMARQHIRMGALNGQDFAHGNVSMTDAAAYFATAP